MHNIVHINILIKLLNWRNDARNKFSDKIICESEIEQYLKWLDSYCKKNACSFEQTLNEIIES